MVTAPLSINRKNNRRGSFFLITRQINGENVQKGSHTLYLVLTKNAKSLPQDILLEHLKFAVSESIDGDNIRPAALKAATWCWLAYSQLWKRMSCWLGWRHPYLHAQWPAGNVQQRRRRMHQQPSEQQLRVPAVCSRRPSRIKPEVVKAQGAKQQTSEAEAEAKAEGEAACGWWKDGLGRICGERTPLNGRLIRFAATRNLIRAHRKGWVRSRAGTWVWVWERPHSEGSDPRNSHELLKFLVSGFCLRETFTHSPWMLMAILAIGMNGKRVGRQFHNRMFCCHWSSWWARTCGTNSTNWSACTRWNPDPIPGTKAAKLPTFC